MGLDVRRNTEPGALITPPPPIMGHWAESNIRKKRHRTRVVQRLSYASVRTGEVRVRNRTQTRERTVEPIDFGASEWFGQSVSDHISALAVHKTQSVVDNHLLPKPVVSSIEMLHARSRGGRLGHLDAGGVVFKHRGSTKLRLSLIHI